MKTALVIGGSSGLGLALAKRLMPEYSVVVTGRIDPKIEGIEFRQHDLTSVEHGTYNESWYAVDGHKELDLLVYAAGFYQEGTLGEIKQNDIDAMLKVGLIAPIYMLHQILKYRNLPGFIAITSTSQWTPREKEPVYTAVKAGLAMLANSVSLDPKVGKVLVAAPAGMNTPFWRNSPRSDPSFLDPDWVAEQVLEQYRKTEKYRFAKIMRKPPRVELIEER